jgi:hypothetical protein
VECTTRETASFHKAIACVYWRVPDEAMLEHIDYAEIWAGYRWESETTKKDAYLCSFN